MTSTRETSAAAVAPTTPAAQRRGGSIGTLTGWREWLAVGGIWLAGGLAASIFALQLVEYLIMPDELGYLKQAILMSHGVLPTPSTFWFNSWALLRPASIAPAYKLFSTPTAFDVAHVTGAFVMASVVVPAYLLAKRVTGHVGASLLVAALCVFVPWLAMAGSMMSEVVAYPAFVWAVLAIVHAIERPSWRSDVLLAAGLGLAFLARTQLLVLAPVAVAAIVLDALVRRGDGGVGRRLVATARAHWLIGVGIVVGALFVIGSGASPQRFLGGYSEPLRGALFPPGTAVATREILSYVVVGIGVLPLALGAAWVALTLLRRGAQTAAASAIGCVVVVLTLVGGIFTVRFTAGINDRYLFYIAPLLFTATAALLLDARRDGLWRAAVGAAGALTVWLVYTSSLSQHGPSLVSPTMSFHDVLSARGHDVGLSGPHLAAVGGGLALIAIAIAGPRLRRGLLLGIVGGVLLAYCAGETLNTYEKIGATQSSAGAAFLSSRNWIDKAVPGDTHVGAIVSEVGDPTTTMGVWWDTSFWNKTVRDVYVGPDGDTFQQGFELRMAVDPETGRVPTLDHSAMLVRPGDDTRFGLRGSQTVASHGALELITAQRPYSLDWLFKGADPERAVVDPGTSATVRVYGKPTSRAIDLTLQAAKPSSYRVSTPAGVVRGSLGTTDRVTRRVPVTFSGPGHADITISVPKGAQPVQFLSALAA